jgi:hypothetical protein
MATVFDILPGVEVPVGDIAPALAKIWEGEPGSGARAPSEFRASQMNLVLHFGLRTDGDDAQRQFDTVVAFTHRYPCRTLILCPQPEGPGETAMRAKIFSECFIGSSGREMSCCEMVFLSYPPASRPFLENEVSICLEGDLPLFYWPHGIASSRRLADYAWLLRTARRIILDTTIETADLVQLLSAGQPGRVHDLAYARLLPVRQSLGQFFSGQPPTALVENLAGVTLACQPDYTAGAACLRAWIEDGLRRCGLPPTSSVTFAVQPTAAATAPSLQLRFAYAGGTKHFAWQADFTSGEALFDADFGNGRLTLPTSINLLNPVAALGEALFF